MNRTTIKTIEYYARKANMYLNEKNQIWFDKNTYGYAIENFSGSVNLSGRCTAKEAVMFLRGIITAIELTERIK